MNKTAKDYEKDIQKEFLALNVKKATLIELREAYTNGFQLANGKKKEDYKRLIKRTDTDRAMLKRESDYLRSVKENFSKAKIFNRETLMPILAYITSVMENQEYAIGEKEITFFDDKIKPVVGPIYYKFKYLTPKKDMKKSKDELEAKYPYALSAERFQVKDLFQGESYTGIFLFKDQDTTNLICSLEPINMVSSERQDSFGYLNNENLPYLKEFMDFLITYRIYKECEFAYPLDENLSYEELYNLANQFIEDKKGKNYTK